MRPKGRRAAILTAFPAAAVLGVAAFLGWPHIRFLWMFEPLDRNAEGYREYRHRQTGIVFVGLPGGTFLMGSPPEEEGRRGDEFRHEVTLSPFLIAKHEVTKAQWVRATGMAARNQMGDEFPIFHIWWEETQVFCRRTDLLLPTEAQWEYACRGGSQGKYGGTGVLQEMGWYRESGSGMAHPIGQKRPNRFGLHDMHGNAEEWCQDVYDERFFERPEASGRDPVCLSGSEHRVSRGGFRWDPEENCRSAARRKRKLGPQNCAPGIRPAWSPSR